MDAGLELGNRTYSEHGSLNEAKASLVAIARKRIIRDINNLLLDAPDGQSIALFQRKETLFWRTLTRVSKYWLEPFTEEPSDGAKE